MAAKIASDTDARRLAMNMAGMLPANRAMRARVLEYLAKVVPFLDGEELKKEDVSQK